MSADPADAARRLIETDVLLGVTDVPIGVSSSRRQSASATVVEATAPRLVTDAEQRLAALRERHDAECPHCTASRSHRQTVFGEGSASAQLFFVGEAPGETEDQVGRPFVGRAGQKLDEMIKAMGFRREDCYIANVLKSRPPNNRTPLPDEIAKCGPYLVEQIMIIRPKVLVPLGGPATQLLLGVDIGITRLRGTWTQWMPPRESGAPPVPVMPTFHPAYLLRNYTVETRALVWSDLKAVVERLQSM